MDEELEMYAQLADQINKTINSVLKKHFVDRLYYKFKVSIDKFGIDLIKMSEHILINDNDSFCEFCGKPSRKRMKLADVGEVIVCAECAKDIVNK